ncbi:prepilin-type N-terminal cleavage/methylation domain-containing protein [Planctomycetales bacterium ZRK34]|nr:prepilin-type N-terminal cleavage/methylation domain-containing protein [Planctomycetales bacterium ZRK34]
MMSRVNAHRNQGFSLVELIIVVVIIAIIGAIAIPRMSRGAAGASESALVGDLAILRSAIDLYAAEHAGEFPPAATFEDHMTGYSNAAGDSAQATKDSTHIYGPYMRKIPPLPVGTNKGETSVVDGSATAIGTATGGWWYDPTTGVVKANLPDAEADDTTKAYNAY